MDSNENNQNSSLVTFNIKISGQEIPSNMPVARFTINKQASQKNTAVVTILKPSDFEENALGGFNMGETIMIELGYDGKNTLVFEGVIESQTFLQEKQGEPILMISCAENLEEVSFLDILKMANAPGTPVYTATYGNQILSILANLNLENDGKTKVYGNFEIAGTNNIQPNNFIELNGLSNQYNGTHFVHEVRQIVENGNWLSRVFFGF